MRRVIERILCTPGSMVLLAALLPAPVDGQQLRAVYVHGESVPAPFIIEGDAALGCLWFHTYNQHVTESVAPAVSSPAVVISFFTAEAWSARAAQGAADSLTAQLDLARFHTRVFPTPAGVRPVIEYRKAAGLGPFVPRGRIPLASEYYLASLRIPTRLDSAGRPVVREFTAAEVAEARAALRSVAPCAPATK
jgi:hypothetical protein